MNAIPWYKSRILQGLLTILVSQVISRIQSQYHVDFLGISVNEIVAWLMDVISAAGAYWAAHARIAPSVPIPPVVTLTRSGADKVNLDPPLVQPPPEKTK